MMFVDPRAHMISRTTDDYEAMAASGVALVSILAIGPDAATVFAAYLNSHPECRFNTVAGQDVGEHRGTLGGYTIPRLSRTRLGVHG